MSDALDTGAIFSPDRAYRYLLWRRWDTEAPTCAFIGLNPSTADETTDDPTIRRCIGFARRWGYGSIRMLNVFAFRATDPMVMRAATDPVGPMNDRYLVECCAGVDVVGAWGTHARYMDRGAKVLDLLWSCGITLSCLGKTKEGHPKHPLYLANSTQRVKL